MTHSAAHVNVMIPKGALDTVSAEEIYAQVEEIFDPYAESTDNPEYLETVEDEEFGSYMYNPNAQWDWYVIGGRFDGLLDRRNGVTSYMDGNLATAEDMYVYASKSLTQLENIAIDFLAEYASIVRNFGAVPAVPEYKDVRDGKMTDKEFFAQMKQFRESAFYEEVANLIGDTSDKVKEVSGTEPNYLGQFSTMPMDIIRYVTLEDAEKDFQACVNILEWFTVVNFVDWDNWSENEEVGWFGYIEKDKPKEKKWVYEYVELLKQAAQKSTDDEQSCIVVVDVHI